MKIYSFSAFSKTPSTLKISGAIFAKKAKGHLKATFLVTLNEISIMNHLEQQVYDRSKKSYPEQRQISDNNFKESDTDNEKKNRFRKTNEFIDYKFGAEDYGPLSDDNKVVIPSKPCSKCSKMFKLTEFNKSKKHKDGHKPYCKYCDRKMEFWIREKWKASHRRAIDNWTARNKRKQYDYVNKYKRKMRAIKRAAKNNTVYIPEVKREVSVIPVLPHQEFKEMR